MNPHTEIPPYFGMPMSLNTSNKYPQQAPYMPKKGPYNQFPKPNRNMMMKKGPKGFQDFFKTQLCPMLANGNCVKGEQCTYAHSEAELRKRPDFIKTKLCDNFMKTGSCFNGEQCMFAHGYEELKSTPDFYKTALCFNWKNTGSCQAGDRCRYAHGEGELKKLSPEFENNNNNNNFPPKYKKQDPMENTMDTYFPGPFPQQNMMPPQNPYEQNYRMNNMGGNEQQNFMFMGANSMPQPPFGSKQNMNYNPYEQQQNPDPYMDFAGFPNRK